MFCMTKKIGRCYFIFLSFLLVSISGPSNSHEVSVRDLILYHPSLFFEKEGEGEAFFSVLNEGSDSDYIIGIQSEFSKTGGIHASGLFSSDGKLISFKN